MEIEDQWRQILTTTFEVVVEQSNIFNIFIDAQLRVRCSLRIPHINYD